MGEMMEIHSVYRSLATGRILKVVHVENGLVHFHNGEVHVITVINTAQFEVIK
jgi:hypothetical protein